VGGIPPEILGTIFTGGGSIGLITLAVVMIYTGRLVPRHTHEETRADRDAWRKAYEDTKKSLDASEAARQVQAQQLGEVLETTRATEKLMTTIQTALIRRAGGGR